jgi:hypothetical protein
MAADERPRDRDEKRAQRRPGPDPAPPRQVRRQRRPNNEVRPAQHLRRTEIHTRKLTERWMHG